MTESICHVLYCYADEDGDCWNWGSQEALLGGQYLGTFPSLAEALTLLECFRDPEVWFGRPGELVITTGPYHRRVDLRGLLPCPR